MIPYQFENSTWKIKKTIKFEILKFFEAHKEKKWDWSRVYSSWEKRKSKISLEDQDSTVKKFENGIAGMFHSTSGYIWTLPVQIENFRWHIFRFMRDCPTGKLQKSEFVAIYKELFPNGNAKTFSEFIFNVFDADGNGTIEACLQNNPTFEKNSLLRLILKTIKVWRIHSSAGNNIKIRPGPEIGLGFQTLWYRYDSHCFPYHYLCSLYGYIDVGDGW